MSNLVYDTDRAIAAALQTTALQHNEALHAIGTAFNWWGGPGVIWLAAILWLGGRALRLGRLSLIGLRGAEAIAVASALNGIVKGLAGRTRPFFTPGEPWHWNFSHGWTDAHFASMPSGHTLATIAFAAAASVASARLAAWQRGAVIVATFAAALLVAFARMYTNQHWFSDVVVGAALGGTTGLLLTRWHERHPRTCVRSRATGRHSRIVSRVRRRGFFLLALGATSAFAQSAPGAAPPHDPIFRTGDAVIFGAALAGSALLVRYDARITAWKGVPAFQNSTRVRGTLDAAAFLGGPGSIAIDAAIWGVGRIANNRDRWTDGETALEAAALSGAVTYLLKGMTGRARPTLDSTRADNFRFGRGFWAGDDYRSFPSGHTTAAFAFATALTTRLSARRSSSANWAAPALFSIATVTAVGRLYNHKHWMSDCLTGAAIGTIGGLVAARWHERHP